MVESKPEAWRDIVRRIEDTGVDGIELNYGCPHGMSERGMGSAVGQVPEYCEQITGWVKNSLPNTGDREADSEYHEHCVSRARRGGCQGRRHLIDQHAELDHRGGFGHARSDSGALRQKERAWRGLRDRRWSRSRCCTITLSAVATDEAVAWSQDSDLGDGRDFELAGCGRVFALGRELFTGLHRSDALRVSRDRRPVRRLIELDGRERLPNGGGDCGQELAPDFGLRELQFSFSAVARIDAGKCIKCNLCYVACNDAAHQCIELTAGASGERPQPQVREEDCVGCRLCYNVCPVEHCIEMAEVADGRAPVSWRELCQSQPEVAEDWEAMELYRKEKGIQVH